MNKKVIIFAILVLLFAGCLNTDQLQESSLKSPDHHSTEAISEPSVEKESHIDSSALSEVEEPIKLAYPTSGEDFTALA